MLLIIRSATCTTTLSSVTGNPHGSVPFSMWCAAYSQMLLSEDDGVVQSSIMTGHAGPIHAVYV